VLIVVANIGPGLAVPRGELGRVTGPADRRRQLSRSGWSWPAQCSCRRARSPRPSVTRGAAVVARWASAGALFSNEVTAFAPLLARLDLLDAAEQVLDLGAVPVPVLHGASAAPAS
jgi:hypothetical protein